MTQTAHICLVCGWVAAQLLTKAASGQADSAAADPMFDRRTAYETAYRECGKDSLQRLVRNGAIASDVARDYVGNAITAARAAVVAPGEPRREWDRAFAGCLAALTGAPSGYDTAASRAEAAQARARPRESESMLGSFAWVFYLDVLFAIVAFAVAAAYHHRDAARVTRNAWVVAWAILGAFFGALAFLGVGMGAAIVSITSPASERTLAAITSLVIAFVALGVAAPSRRWRL